MSGSPTASADLPQTIDTGMFGTLGSTAAFLVPAARPALIDSGAASTVERVCAELDAAGIDRLAAIVLTHVHFDHAGGAGHLAARYPEAEIYIDRRVARHLIDPTRLSTGVKQVWGSRTEELFGLPLPVPAERVRPLDDGDTIELGDRALTAIATPGHTRAHLAIWDGDTDAVICGDALGNQVGGGLAIRPAAPPADFSYHDAVASIRALAARRPEAILMSHFGPALPDPAEACDEAERALSRWRQMMLELRAVSGDRDELVRLAEGRVEAELEVEPAQRARLEGVNPVWLNVDGLTGDLDR